ncbi:MAG: HlyD family efflux transporter periplasmic adaptor subunit [Tolumonas sp.]|nr:HlyD family efflux transporter periplasmic adaptor subunit [Tolumonas sp.]
MRSPSLFHRSLTWILLCLLGASAAAGYWYYHRAEALPAGLVYGNGRLEATEIDIATKLAGRLDFVTVHEGDDVQRGQLVATLTADELQAQLRGAQAQAQQARENAKAVRASVASAESQQYLAQLTHNRTAKLMSKNVVSKDQLDQTQSALQVAQAALNVVRNQIKEADAAVAAADANVEALSSTLQDSRLTAPIAGRILYRLAEPGEVLAAGGKVVTLLDLNDVTMSVYLPAADAGKITLGSSAKIMLDALPDPVPAKVVFVSPRAQFTPKEVETRNEREKLMFRIKVKVEPSWLAAHAAQAKPGMPGVVYLQTDTNAKWPAIFPVR